LLQNIAATNSAIPCDSARMMHIVGMDVTLDGNPVVIARPSLAAAIAEGVRVARAKGRVIIEVKGDGAMLSDEALTSPSEREDQFQQIQLISAEPRTLVKVTLGDGAEALRALHDEQQRVAGLIHADKGQDAIAGLQSIFQTWTTVKDLVERGGSLLDADLGDVQIGTAPSETFNIASTRLLGHLRRVRTALSNQDWAALADVLEYDLCTEAQAWEQLLDGLAAHVSSLPPRAQGGVDAP
jgi:hypothetical protein